MYLLDYVNKHFPPSGDWEDAAFIEHFLETFGVNAKKEKGPYGTYWIFKYGMIIAKWKPETIESRGAILHRGERYGIGREEWMIMSWPFNKFFNQHEGKCPVFGDKTFNNKLVDMTFVEKSDGTCIQLWWDQFNNKWRVSTLGMLTTTKVSDFSEETFESLFWKTLGLKPENLTELSKDSTYIFELCSAENRIVTQYEEDTVYVLGRRNLRDGNCISWDHPLKGYAKEPHCVNLYNEGLRTLQECKDWVEAQAKSDQYGKYPEGFVVYGSDNHPIAKMKNSAYLVLHHASGAGNLAHSLNCAIDSFWKGSIDDIWEVLPDPVRERIEVLKDWYSKKIVEISNSINEIRKVEYKPGKEGQKDYALAVQKHIDRKMQAFFFQNRMKVEDKSVNAAEFFMDWMRINAGKWADYWKEVMKEYGKSDLKVK